MIAFFRQVIDDALDVLAVRPMSLGSHDMGSGRSAATLFVSFQPIRVWRRQSRPGGARDVKFFSGEIAPVWIRLMCSSDHDDIKLLLFDDAFADLRCSKAPRR